jgi:AhpC/TSA family
VNRLAVYLLAASVAMPATLDLAGNARDPFGSPARARVFLFVRTDCPITNRYAPEFRRLAGAFPSVDFWMVYPDSSESTDTIRRHMMDFSLPGQVLRDPRHELVKRAHVTTAPEAAVFDSENRLVYHGRIDDLWVNPGVSRPVARTHDLEDAISAVLEGKPLKLSETHAVGCSLADVK